MSGKASCSTAGCSSATVARRLCRKHYQAAWKGGDLEAAPKAPRVRARTVCPPEHRHALSSTCYIQHQCRCEPCRDALSLMAENRRRLKAYGRFDTGLVDAEPVREHLLMLGEFGLGYKRVADLAGVGITATRNILWGRQNAGERLAAHAEIARVRGPWPWDRPGHGWKLAITTGYANTDTPGHTLVILDADLRCHCRLPYTVTQWEELGGCRCVGSLLSQANCPDCRWHAFGEENTVVEAWHDHAFPGWRDLPALPLTKAGDNHDGMKWTKKALAFIADNYPAEWQTPGAPVITQRSHWGTRHVPRRSPWGGYDISSTAIGGELKTW